MLRTAGKAVLAAVWMTGLAWADDKKPTAPKADDKKPAPVKPEAKKADDPKVDVAGLKKQIAAAAERGDAAEVRRLTAELERAVTGGPTPPDARRPGPSLDRARDAFERSIRDFEEQLERLKGDPEAGDQLRKAVREYRRAMEDALRSAGPAAPNPDGRPGVRGARPPRLGVALAPVPEPLADQLDLPAGKGVLVADVLPGSPADKAGLKRFDVLLRFAGQDVPAEPEGAVRVVGGAKAGEKVDATVLRKGKKQELKGIEVPDAPRRPERRADRDPEPRPGNRVNFDTVQTQVTDGRFTVQATRDGVKYRLTGAVEDGKPVPSAIEIRDGDEAVKADSLEKVPEKHRAAVKQLLGNVGGR